MGEPNTPSVFYHYTTPENLENIKRQGMINPFLCSPLIPSVFADIDIKDTPAIFFTRMDPSNPKESIAFNNYGDGWRSKLRNVERWIAVMLFPSPYLLEHTVLKGKVFRNVVAWLGGPLPIDFSSCNTNQNHSMTAPQLPFLPPQLPQLPTPITSINHETMMINTTNSLTQTHELTLRRMALLEEKFEELSKRKTEFEDIKDPAAQVKEEHIQEESKDEQMETKTGPVMPKEEPKIENKEETEAEPQKRDNSQAEKEPDLWVAIFSVLFAILSFWVISAAK